MRLEKVTVRNLGPFRDFTLDLTGPEKVIAITGPNGAGKSTILEVGLPGAMYRQTPTRGSLVDLATARDGMVEARVVNGSAWTLRHLVDKVSGKSEAVVLDAAGATVLPDSKVRSFDAWAAKHLPSPEVLYACMFTPQKAGGFLAAKPGERKAILLRILGVERLEAQAELAREHARATKTKLDVLAARIEDERARGGDVAAAQADVEVSRETSKAADAALVAAREALVRLEAEAREAEERWRAVAEVRATRARLTGERKDAADKVQDLQQRVRNNRAVLAEAKAIRSAVADMARLTVEVGNVRAAAEKAEADARREAARARELDGRLRDVNVTIERAETVFAGRALVVEAERAIPGLEVAVNEAAGAVGVAEDALTDLQGQRVAGAEDRIKGLRGGLDEIIDTDARREAVGIAAKTRDADDQAVALATELPAQVKQAEAALRAARERKAAAEKKLADVRTVAARRAALDSAEHSWTDATSQRAGIEAAREAAAAAEHVAADGARAHRVKLSGLEAELAVAQPIANKAGPLAGAEGRLAELEPVLETERERVTTLDAELAAKPEPRDPPAVPSTRDAKVAVEAAETRARAALAAVAGAEHRFEIAQAAGGRLAGLEGERTGIEAELADWNRVAADLGRDGLQAAEIDAAGPELTDLVNDLLHACHGPRFSVRVETQRLSADGKRMLEGCDVVVLDTEKGREAQGETFSGGEQTFIAEALSLALSMLACRRAGLSGVTLIRDESGAALSENMRPFYVPMLRRAAESIVNGKPLADKIVFVSHFADVVEMADARIEVRS